MMAQYSVKVVSRLCLGSHVIAYQALSKLKRGPGGTRLGITSCVVVALQ